MSIAYKRQPPLRMPCVQPLFHETYLQAMYRQRLLTDHYRRCDYAQPTIDDGPPASRHWTIQLRLKALLKEGERLARIERENKYLLKTLVRTARGPGCVDHYHKKILAPHTTSLNYTARKQSIARINEENKKMLKRILGTKTCYDHVKMELDYQYKIRSIRGRSYVFKLWNKLTDSRREYIRSGKFLDEVPDYDMDELRSRTRQTHQHCFPSRPKLLPSPEPVPRTSRSPPRAPPVDHERCFFPVPVLPPYRRPRRGRQPIQWPPERADVGAGQEFRENKAMLLRYGLTGQKLQTVRLQNAGLRSRSPSPQPQGYKGRDDNVNQSARALDSSPGSASKIPNADTNQSASLSLDKIKTRPPRKTTPQPSRSKGLREKEHRTLASSSDFSSKAPGKGSSRRRLGTLMPMPPRKTGDRGAVDKSHHVCAVSSDLVSKKPSTESSHARLDKLIPASTHTPPCKVVLQPLRSEETADKELPYRQKARVPHRPKPLLILPKCHNGHAASETYPGKTSALRDVFSTGDCKNQGPTKGIKKIEAYVPREKPSPTVHTHRESSFRARTRRAKSAKVVRGPRNSSADHSSGSLTAPAVRDHFSSETSSRLSTKSKLKTSVRFFGEKDGESGDCEENENAPSKTSEEGIAASTEHVVPGDESEDSPRSLPFHDDSVGRYTSKPTTGVDSRDGQVSGCTADGDILQNDDLSALQVSSSASAVSTVSSTTATKSRTGDKNTNNDSIPIWQTSRGSFAEKTSYLAQLTHADSLDTLFSAAKLALVHDGKDALDTCDSDLSSGSELSLADSISPEDEQDSSTCLGHSQEG